MDGSAVVNLITVFVADDERALLVPTATVPVEGDMNTVTDFDNVGGSVATVLDSHVL